MAKAKTKSKTLATYKRYRALKWGLYSSVYALPLVPASVLTAINWDEWVAQTGNSWSLGLGFGSLLLSLLITILAVAKKDKFLKDLLSPVFYIALILGVWSVSFLLLSSILHNFGQMLLFTSLSLIVSGGADQVRTKLVEPQLSFYKDLVVTNKLNPKWEEKRKLKEERTRLATEEALREGTRQATE